MTSFAPAGKFWAQLSRWPVSKYVLNFIVKLRTTLVLNPFIVRWAKMFVRRDPKDKISNAIG
jgi:hypothetical protein